MKVQLFSAGSSYKCAGHLAALDKALMFDPCSSFYTFVSNTFHGILRHGLGEPKLRNFGSFLSFLSTGQSGHCW